MIDRILSHLKAAAIHFANWLTLKLEPYQNFTRMTDPRDVSTLRERAERFDQDLHARFTIRGGTIINYRIPLPVGSPLDLGDQAIWHGIYTAAEAFAFALGNRDSGILAACLQGLEDQQPNGILIRGIDEDGRKQFDASNDSATGHLAGLYFSWKYGTQAHAAAASRIMNAWAHQIVDHDYALINPDGKPTPFGPLAQGWKTDPLRASLLMAILSAAYRMTGELLFYSRFRDVAYRFDPMIPFAKARLFTLDTHYDTHRAAIHLSILGDLDPKDQRSRYGLDKLAELARKQGNVWVLALAGRVLGFHPADRSLALKVLSEITPEDKAYNVTRQLSLNPMIAKKWYGGQWVGYQPPAKWRKTARDFVWQDHPYSLDGRGNAGDPPDSMLNGGDFLAAYRLCRLEGVLNADD